MSALVDRLLVQLSDPTRLSQILAPATDPAPTRVRRLVDAVFAFPFATIHAVNKVSIGRMEIAKPVLARRCRRGTWTQTAPSHRLTDVAYEELGSLEALWMDLTAEVQITLLLEVDSGAIDSVLTSEVSDFASLADFRSRFPFLNVDALLARYNITTVDELREHYHFLKTAIQLRQPGPFDPNDPANQYAFSFNVAVLIRDALDIRGVLQEAKRLRVAMKRDTAFEREIGPAEVHAPYALLVVWPEAVLTGQPLAANDIVALFAVEQILVLFLTPS
jgi:hypothetical protein